MNTFEKLRLIALAQTCKSRMEFQRRFTAQYKMIARLGMGDEIFAAAGLSAPKRWTTEELAEIGKRYRSRAEWMADHPASLQAAYRRGIVDDVGPPSRPGRKLAKI